MNALKISIVVPSFQQRRYLEATLKSLVDQQYPDLEILVMDGGSDDGSIEIIHRFESHLAFWTSARDDGQTDALIRGFERATGEIFGWLCSDDLLLPDTLVQIGRFFQHHPEIDAVYGDALWIDAAGRVLRPKKEMRFNRLALRYDHNFLPQPATFWRRRIYHQVGGLDRSFNLAMDGDLWSRIARAGRFAHLPDYLACMRYYPQQKTRCLRLQALADEARIRARDGYGWSPTLEKLVLRPAARLTRIGLKGIAGGYTGRVPAHVLRAAERYRLDPPE